MKLSKNRMDRNNKFLISIIYIIRKNKYLSEGTLAKIKRGEPINMKSLNAICCMLRKNVNDVIDIEITDDEKIKYFI